MFDKPGHRVRPARSDGDVRDAPEEERIALRCSRKELQLLDSFVASGEYPSRSELMRGALRAFLRERAASGVPSTARPTSPEGLVEVPVRLRPDEVEAIEAFGELASNGLPITDLLAQLVRRGELELKVQETVQRHRASVKGAAEAQERLRALGRSGAELARRGVLGR